MSQPEKLSSAEWRCSNHRHVLRHLYPRETNPPNFPLPKKGTKGGYHEVEKPLAGYFLECHRDVFDIRGGLDPDN